MFVGMWMTKNVLTVEPSATIGEVATLMMRHRIRRVPVVDPTHQDLPLVGIVSNTDVMHAFPSDVNPFSATAAESLAARERASNTTPATVAAVMTRNPATTTLDAPIEAAARTMRDRKIGALPVVSHRALVGLITESDIFRAFIAIFESTGRGARITFDIARGEDAFPLLADIAQRRGLRIVNVVSLPKHERQVCVVQVSGDATQAMLDDIWKSHHRVVHVVELPLP